MFKQLIETKEQIESIRERCQRLGMIVVGEPIYEDEGPPFHANRNLSDIFDEQCNLTHWTDETYDNDFYCLFKREFIPKNIDLSNIASHFNLLWEKAKPSPFGNLSEGRTEYNEEVRSSREIDASYFTEYSLTDVIREIKEDWYDKTKQVVKPVPYKLLLYPVGGSFKPHVDTPEPKLIGTTIFHLSGPKKVFEVDGTPWTKGHICNFYADIPHEVKPCDEPRMVITFKIYDASYSSEISTDDKTVSTFVKRIKKTKRDKFGVLLKHGYSYEDSTFKGVDKKLIDILDSLGWTYEVQPVIVYAAEVGYSGDYNDVMERSDTVLPDSVNTLEIYEFDLNKSRKTRGLTDINTPFYYFGTGGYRWTSEVGQLFHTGNCYVSGLESVYLNKALIVHPN